MNYITMIKKSRVQYDIPTVDACNKRCFTCLKQTNELCVEARLVPSTIPSAGVCPMCVVLSPRHLAAISRSASH